MMRPSRLAVLLLGFGCSGVPNPSDSTQPGSANGAHRIISPDPADNNYDMMDRLWGHILGESSARVGKPQPWDVSVHVWTGTPAEASTSQLQCDIEACFTDVLSVLQNPVQHDELFLLEARKGHKALRRVRNPCSGAGKLEQYSIPLPKDIEEAFRIDAARGCANGNIIELVVTLQVGTAPVRVFVNGQSASIDEPPGCSTEVDVGDVIQYFPQGDEVGTKMLDLDKDAHQKVVEFLRAYHFDKCKIDGDTITCIERILDDRDDRDGTPVYLKQGGLKSWPIDDDRSAQVILGVSKSVVNVVWSASAKSTGYSFTYLEKMKCEPPASSPLQ